jgi:hypothetical protein
MGAALLLLAAALAPSACAGEDPPRFRAELPAGSGKWVDVEAEPAWVAAPPRKAGTLRFVAENRSNLHGIVFGRGAPSAAAEAAAEVRERVASAAEEAAAAAAAAAVPGALTLLQTACREEVLSRDLVPGNTLCTGWALWELDLAKVAAAVPEHLRAQVLEALEE